MGTMQNTGICGISAGYSGTIPNANAISSIMGTEKTRPAKKAPKKRLNYNPREISNQLMRAGKSRNAAIVLIRAKRNVSVLKSAHATGQYDNKEIKIALDHAKRMVECSKLKVSHLKEEERMQGKNERERHAREQQKENEIKRRTHQKEQQLKIKMVQGEHQRILKEKSKRQELRQKRRMHRRQEQNEILDADLKYLKSQTENKPENQSLEFNGVALEMSMAAVQMAELQQMEQQIEQQAKIEAEMEVGMAAEAAFLDAKSISTPSTESSTPSSAETGSNTPAINVTI